MPCKEIKRLYKIIKSCICKEKVFRLFINKSNTIFISRTVRNLHYYMKQIKRFRLTKQRMLHEWTHRNWCNELQGLLQTSGPRESL